MDEKVAASPPTGKSLNGPVVLLKDSWGIFKALWKKLFILTLLPYLSLIPFGVVAALFVGGGFLLYSGGNWVGVIVLATIGILLSIIFLSIVFSVATIAMLYMISERAKQLSIKESLKMGWRILWSYWTLAFISGLLIMGGYLLFIIPGIIFSVWFSLSLYVLIVEGAKGMDAITRSREYVRGYWWGVLGRILFITLITYAIMFGSSYIFSLFEQDSIGGVIQFLLSILITPFTVIYTFLIYAGLKKIKPEVASLKASGKGMYIIVALLGLGVLIALSYFVIMIGVTAFENMQDGKMYGPGQRIREATPPDLTYSPTIYLQS